MTLRPGKPVAPKLATGTEVPHSRELSGGNVRPTLQQEEASDEELIAAFLQGRAEAFSVLVRRYQNRLFNTLSRYLNQDEDALDVVQETFLSACQALPRFKRGSQFYTWLYRIAMNHAIDLRRRKVRLAFAGGMEGLENATDDSRNSKPESLAEQKEAGELVQRALMCLSGEHRLVLVLKDIDEMQYEEIAEVIGVPIGTVRSRLHRARLELRDVLTRMAPASAREE
jgi:RNA polymerase sigma-70 factor (ECF subfamily)